MSLDGPQLLTDTKAASPSGARQDRHTTILDAAGRCFARSGFHQASMNDICAEAGMSAGNLYRYFPSKVAIISGIVERDLAQAARDFSAVNEAPDFFEGMRLLARQYMLERTDEEVGLCTEMMAESRRNPDITKVYQEVQQNIRAGLSHMLRTAAARGEIRSDLDFENAAAMLMVLADGMSWRRSADPGADMETLLTMMFDMVRHLLGAPAESVESTR